MSIKDWFKTDAERFASAVPQSRTNPVGAPTGPIPLANGIDQVNEQLPRGINVIRSVIDRKEAARWAMGHEILEFAYRPGDLLIGKYAGTLIGVRDDKMITTIASARSGKTLTVLKPALFTYPGSMLVLDPKGELARDTAAHRRERLGQETFVLDPFNCSGEASSPYNPLAELDVGSPTLVDDVDALAQALILPDGSGENSHWTNSAESLVRSLLLYTLQQKPELRHLPTMRELLQLTFAPLVETQKAFAKNGSADPMESVQNALFMDMAKDPKLFGGALAGAGNSFLRKNVRERSAIISTAETQTRFLDSTPMQAALKTSAFSIKALAERPMTIYLCLPFGEMDKHARWLRMLVRSALLALERRGTYERDKLPIVFLCEEAAILGYFAPFEHASAYFPSFGVKLWLVWQDANQIARNFPKSWQTFLGNSGTIQVFGLNDAFTLSHVSDRLGSLSFVRGRFGAIGGDHPTVNHIDKERLAYGAELAMAFSRKFNSQLLMVHGCHPMAIERFTPEEVALIRDRL